MEQTSIHVRRAIDGDRGSIGWLVSHFHPFVAAQVRLRLGSRETAHDVEDLTGEVRLVTLRRLSDLEPRGGRFAPVLVRFLGTTVVQLCNNHLRRCIRGEARRGDADREPVLEELPADTLGVVTRASAGEFGEQVRHCLDTMPEDKRNVLVLRLMEHATNQEIAQSLGIPANTVAVRYRRALEELRQQLAVVTVALAALAISALLGYLASKQTEIARGEQLLAHEALERTLNEGFEQVGEGNPNAARPAFEAALKLAPESVEAIAGLAIADVRCGDSKAALAALELANRLPAADRRALSWVRVHVLRHANDPEAERIAATLPEPARPIEFFLAGFVQLQEGERSNDKTEFAGAVELLSDAVRQAQTARLLYHVQLAHAAAHAGDRTEIERSAKALPALWPDSARAWFYVGFALSRLDDREHTIAAYRQALRLRPDYANAHCSLGYEFERSGDLDGAIACYQEATRRDPKLALAWYDLGNALETKGKPGEALRLWIKAGELDPSLAEAHNNAGQAFLRQGNLRKARRHLEAAVAAKPEYPEAWNNLGALRARRNQLDAATEAFEKAVALRPDYASAQGNLGTLYFYKKDYVHAVRCLRSALRKNDRSAALWNTLGTIAQSRRNFEPATVAYEKALALDPKLTAARANLAEVWLQRGNVDKAWEQVQAALAADPGMPNALGTSARILFQRGETQQAIDAVEKALPRARRHPGMAQGLEKDLASYRRALHHEEQPAKR